MKGVFKHITLPAAVAAFLVAELVPLRGTQTVPARHSLSFRNDL